MSGSGDDSWKIFNRDDEAGRLLSRLYGVNGVDAAASVSYPPKRRRRPRVADAGRAAGHAARWKMTYKAAEEEKERERKENISRALSLAVPKVGRGARQQRRTVHGSAAAAHICRVPRRKTEATCKRTQEEHKEKARHYRPSAGTTRYASDKRRLQGGDEGERPPKDSTGAAPDHAAADAPAHAVACTLFEQLQQEILERREHQLRMEEIGAGAATREATGREIQERMDRLRRLDATRAVALVQKLMKS